MNAADREFFRELRAEAQAAQRAEIWDGFCRDRDRNPDKYRTAAEVAHDNADPGCPEPGPEEEEDNE